MALRPYGVVPARWTQRRGERGRRRRIDDDRSSFRTPTGCRRRARQHHAHRQMHRAPTRITQCSPTSVPKPNVSANTSGQQPYASQ